MDYKEACEYLNSCHKFGSKKGLDNLKKLLELLGSPHKKLNVIHIAGTNGKGSCCAFISSVLIEQGYNVGVFTSPHLIKYNERYSFNGENISDMEFCSVIENVSQAADKFCGDFFSFFEIVTTAAFLWFCNKNADYVVLEVGLGGRLDSTNVIEKPILSVITSIGFDHTHILGNTIEEISAEKGGIIKKNCPVVLYCQGKKVYNVINGICQKNNSRLFFTKDYNVNIISEDFNSIVFSTQILNKKFDNIKIKMIADYQIKNACNALMCIEVLRKNNVFISDAAVYSGFEKAYISGRTELVKKDKHYIILDGAHNIDGCYALCSYIKKIKEKYKFKITILAGILKDKNFEDMINKFNETADYIILTKPEYIKGLPSYELYKSLKKKDKCIFYDDDYKKAFKTGLENKYTDVLICCGSLYLIGDLKIFLGGNF